MHCYYALARRIRLDTHDAVLRFKARQRGLVNAVGAMRVGFGEIHVRTFSPLGEAVFSEVDDAALASAPRPAAAVRSEISARGEPDLAALPAVSAGPLPLN